ncbi:vesicle transport protein SFT2B-like [Sycon ciliatum]|uniref:vesicle transport protein SFT2B-like n=1 Tax=Sycon ciliatum TaxID=27933 RepID=UPI0020AC1661|eukprot:scpid92662/ scgid18732/ Vesicle transport protein SFT2B; SFT2 domain-containing protein 2
MVNFKKFKDSVNPDAKESTGIVDELKNDMNCCASLSWETRIKGFACCFATGLCLSIIAYVMVFTQNYTAFGLCYSFGTVTALASSFFLVGPAKQLKNMFAEKRLIAVIVLLVMIALTLCSALWWKKGGLCIIFAIFQFLAMAWYSLSYIPFARNAVKSCVTACV